MSEPQKEFLTIPGTIDSHDFFQFAIFDTFRRKKRWKTPLLFAIIMSAFSLVCFAIRKTHAQATLLGTVLLSIGLVLPLVWFLWFLNSVKTEGKKHSLSKTKAQYFTCLGPEMIKVIQGKNETEFLWEDLYMAYRTKGSIYLYINSNRAYLLPECEDSDSAWELAATHLPKDKIRDLR